MKQKLLALMKKLLLLFLAIHVSIICAAGGYVTIDGIKYHCMDKVNNEGEYVPDYAYVSTCLNSITGDVTIAGNISYNNKIYKVTKIGSSAFYGCSSLTSINIPDGVTSIGSSAFHSCSSLTSINIPSGVTSIDHYTFCNCSSLTSINIPSGVTSIDIYAFYNCSSLTSINIPNGVTSIEPDTFYGCSSLTSINIPDGVTSIDDSAFQGCTNLQTVSLSNSSKLESIDNYAFKGCSGLTSMTIPNSVTSIGRYAFAECSGLNSVTIPSRVTAIGDCAFYGCSSLTSINIPDGVTSIEPDTFYGCSSLTSINIPDGVTSIGSCAFSGCSSLTSINIPDGVTSIEPNTFYGCSSLTSINIPDGVASIGSSAFSGCSNLVAVTIPNSVESIGNHAFYNCTGLKEMISYITEPMSVESSTFSNVKATLYVPAGTRLAYLNTKGWNVFPRIREGDGTWPENAMVFANDQVSDVCVKNWDTNGDGYLSYDEAAAVEALSEEFKGLKTITSFEELKYFVNLKTIGDNAFHICSKLASISIPDGVTSIGSYAFYKCSSLTSLTIPASVTSIGDYTFDGCSGLTSVTSYIKEPFEINYNTFRSSYDKATLYVPAGTSGKYKNVNYWKQFSNIKEMGEEVPALNDGDKFMAVNADGVEMTFQVISAAEKTCEVVRQGKDRNTIVTSPVPESITIPAEANGFKVVSVGYQAFYGAKGIKSVIIPEGVTSINTQAFRECYNLASITFPTSLEECGTDSFEDCAFGATVHISDLESWCNVSLPSWDLYGWHLFLNGEEVNDLVIPNGVTSIGESMALVSPLTNCASLTSVTIPASVTKMYAPFSGCSNLTSVTTFAQEPVAIFTGFPNATNSITNATLYVPKGSKAAYEAADYWKDFKEILEIEDETPEDIITFADPNVKVICVANWDTNGDGKLSKTEAAVVTSLGDVFMGNSEITSFDELQYFTGLTTIPDNAFYGCGSLKSIRLPKSLTSIGEYAFEDCTSLETVVSFIETPFELGEGAFCARESYDGGNDWLEFDLHFNLYVPIGTKGLYRAAGWDVDESYGNYRTILSGTPENPGSFTVDGIVYDPIDATTVELIDGKNASGDVAIPSMVTNGNVSYQVTEIGACAFKGNTSLTSIVIPNCIKAIRPFAFNGCTGLTTVISYIETPFSLGALKGVFLNNENVVYATYLQFTLYVPAGTKSLYEQASWTDASRIVEIEDETPEPLPVGSTFTEDNGVIYKVTEGNNVTVINGKNAIGDVVIPDKVVNNGVEYTVTAIAEGAFYKGGETQNAELTSITIPSSVERIEPMTFQYCSSLTSIVIPEGVTSIGSQAFLGCTSLSSVSIPSTVTTVEVNAFSNCTALNDVYITDIAAYCAIPFKYYTSSPLYYAKHLYLNGEEVKELVIPQGVTAIDNYAFYNCRSLNSVTLPSSLTSIGDYVFAGCENITQLISYIKTPENISSAYYYMTERNAELIIPVGSKSKYETATGWKNFQNVVEISAFDINHDYYIDKTDVKNLVNDIMGKRPANYDKTQDDITGDQKVDVQDVVKMVRIIKNRYPNTEAYLGYDPEAAGGDIDIDDPPCVDCGVDGDI